jgi:manganese oxidase
MDQPSVTMPPVAEPESDDAPETAAQALSRRGFLRAAGLAGGGVVAASLAACTTTAAPSWTFGPAASPAAPSAAPSVAPTVAPSASAAPSPSADPTIPAGWSDHDIKARNVVQRYVGNLAPALQGIYGDEIFGKLADILGAETNPPEFGMKPAFVQVPQLVLNDALDPLTPELDGDVKVFRLTIDEMEWRIDEKMPPVAALGYNAQWPGPTIRVNEGDKVRAIFKNNLAETTGVHFHGVEFEDFFMDGVPFLTQKPFAPGEEFTYEFTATRAGSQMYHSHHNATEQVGRGLLGAFIVDPANPTADDNYDREYVWISNDTLGGFTINGHGFPAVVPVLAAQGETVRVRFMNEGLMMHPWHSHGFRMKVTHRDGYELGENAYFADNIGVVPGERVDVNLVADRLGIWAFHCHVLSHVEGLDGMFGMVTALIVVPTKEDVDAIIASLIA